MGVSIQVHTLKTVLNITKKVAIFGWRMYFVTTMVRDNVRRVRGSRWQNAGLNSLDMILKTLRSQLKHKIQAPNFISSENKKPKKDSHYFLFVILTIT